MLCQKEESKGGQAGMEGGGGEDFCESIKKVKTSRKQHQQHWKKIREIVGRDLQKGKKMKGEEVPT